MSAEILRRAAAEIRSDQELNEHLGRIYKSECDAWLAVAEWLTECADDYGKGYGSPDAHALAVARAYLGGAA